MGRCIEEGLKKRYKESSMEKRWMKGRLGQVAENVLLESGAEKADQAALDAVVRNVDHEDKGRLFWELALLSCWGWWW